MTTETNAERLKRVKAEKQHVLMDYYDGVPILDLLDIDWLIQQAERAQRLEIENIHLLKAHELKDMEHQGLVQQLKEFQQENTRLRGALEEITATPLGGSYTDVAEADRYQRIANQALKGESQ